MIWVPSLHAEACLEAVRGMLVVGCLAASDKSRTWFSHPQDLVMDCINGAVLKSIEDVGGRDWCFYGTAVTGNPPGYGL